MLSKYFHACFSDFYHALYYCTLPIVTVVCITYFKKATIAFKWLSILILLTCISEFTALYQGLSYGLNGIVYNIFTPLEFFVYGKIYSCFLNNKALKKGIIGMFITLVAIGVINVMYFQPAAEVPTNTINIEMVFLIFLSLLLFITIRQKPVYENIIAEGVFWFNSAVLFYYSFNILIWGFYGVMYYMPDPPKINRQMLLFSSSLLYIIFTSSILLNITLQNKMQVKDA